MAAIFPSGCGGSLGILQPACLFMSGGTDTTCFEQGEPVLTRTFRRLAPLVHRGELSGIHPIIYFAERMANGALCRKAQGRRGRSSSIAPGWAVC